MFWFLRVRKCALVTSARGDLVGLVFCEIVEVLYLSNEVRVLLRSNGDGVSEDFDRLLRGGD